MTIEEVRNEFDTKLASVRKLMASRTRLWLILLAVAFIILVALGWAIFSKQQDKFSQVDAQVEGLKRNNIFLDSMLREQDTLLIESKVTERKIIERYERIPADVKSLDREQLRREVTNY
jgi:hypothetical protein